MGVLHLRHHHIDQAVAWLRQAAQLPNPSADVFHFLAVALAS